MENILSVSNLSYFYQDGDIIRHILKDITYDFEKGKFYTILGESGSGKTTFLSLISALEEQKSGQINYENINIRQIGLDNYRRNKVGIIFQSYNLIPYMTGIENILVAMSITNNKLPENKETVAKNLLKYVGIDSIKGNRTINKLSGGEQQRVAIARALSTDVNLILADEPTGNLDQEMSEEIVKLFASLAHEHKKCVIMVTHSKEIAKKSDVTLILEKGILKKDE
ncbi:MAG: ABC transporter ATP-binding protein [Bacilli bacterium]|nr:ABC transporter ATP-binding protein [Bacilli bacterium]